jgi:hypothetical protein
VIHGGMKLPDRVNAESVFRNEADLMVATEAAGEGINLQFCHMMINYDIPWNPNRLEQRMGRIHRYGQQKEVFIYNLVAVDTREGQVLQVLFLKLQEIRNAMQSDKVFDVISGLLFNRDLAQLLEDAAASARDMDDILKEIDIVIDEEYIRRVKENLGESLATHIIDYTHMKEMARQAREQRLIPEYTENFFKKAFERLGGQCETRQDGYLAIESIPFDIKQIARNDLSRKKYGDLLKRYPRATFDKETAFKNPGVEFISFGHPLFEAILDYIEEHYAEAIFNGAVFTDPDGVLDGCILFYEGVINDGYRVPAGKRVFSFYIDEAGVAPIPASIIWDLEEKGTLSPGNIPDLEDLKKRARSQAVGELDRYLDELRETRNRQAAIKKKYGIKSLEHLILQLDGDLIKLSDRREDGEKVDLVTRNKEERKKRYYASLEELKQRIAREKELVIGMPRFMGFIRVLPASPGNREEMKPDPQIEKTGMDTAMKYERDNGRDPEDVSASNYGYDIRSTASDGSVRYIEVKARSGRGSVALTRNEWFKAQRFGGEYYLYAVMDAAVKPVMRIYRNPAQLLNPNEVMGVVRYIIPIDQLKEKGTIA